MPNSMMAASEACRIAAASCHEIDFVTAHKSSRQTGEKKMASSECVRIHPADVYTTSRAHYNQRFFANLFTNALLRSEGLARF